MGADPRRHERVQALLGVLDGTSCRLWLARIDAAAASLPAGHADLQPTSGSMRLTVLGDAMLQELLRDVLAGPAGLAVGQRLGPRPQVLSSQCWARRQWPPTARPPGQATHAWHQDGALHARFDRSGEALLTLVTVWVPLVPCGTDAPSLEWVDAPTDELLHPAALADGAVATRHGPEARHHAVLRAGDALVFSGSLLHRTFAHRDMTQPRLSAEFRLVPAGAVSPRLADEAMFTWQPG